MANKLANYMEGSYYVCTTAGFSANFMPNIVKYKNPHANSVPKTIKSFQKHFLFFFLAFTDN